MPAGDLASSSGNDARILILRSIDRPLVRVTRQEPYGACRGRAVKQYRMDVTHYLDRLEIPIGAGMKIRPVNLSRVRIVSLQRKSGIPVFRMEQMGPSDAVQVANGAAEVHVVSSDQQPPPAAAKLGDRLAFLRPQTG